MKMSSVLFAVLLSRLEAAPFFYCASFLVLVCTHCTLQFVFGGNKYTSLTEVVDRLREKSMKTKQTRHLRLRFAAEVAD